jgi:transcriptional regulator with XRE-family HTH domain
MRTPKTTIGQRLRAARLARGLTQAQLAAVSGVQQATLSKLESGAKTRASFTTMACLARALDVRPSWLLSTDPDAPGGP